MGRIDLEKAKRILDNITDDEFINSFNELGIELVDDLILICYPQYEKITSDNIYDIIDTKANKNFHAGYFKNNSSIAYEYKQESENIIEFKLDDGFKYTGYQVDYSLAA